MITANHLIHDVLEIASSGGVPSEFKISDEQILYWIEQTRAILIGQSLNKRDDINDSWIQYIDCLELEQVDSSQCCDAPSDCKILKSVLPLPSTIDTWKDNWILSVEGMDGTSISKSNHFKQKYQKYNKYTSNSSSWKIENNYLYIINDLFLDKVRVGLLAEFPSDLGQFISCSNTPCWTLDSPYPISISMASVITDQIVRTKVQPFMTFFSDNSNDANGDTPQQKIIKNQSRTH